MRRIDTLYTNLNLLLEEIYNSTETENFYNSMNDDTSKLEFIKIIDDINTYNENLKKALSENSTYSDYELLNELIIKLKNNFSEFKFRFNEIIVLVNEYN